MEFDNYQRPSVTVDLVIFSIIEDELYVLLNKRKSEPSKGKWALPGGFVNINEGLEEAAMRVLKDKTGAYDIYLEQLYTWGEVKRDSRGRVITVSYFALVNSGDENLTLGDESKVKWEKVNSSLKLPFDHNDILNYAIQRLKWKFEYTPVAFSLLPKRFTLGQVKKIYDTVFEKNFDKRNFMKKILSMDILKEVGIQEGVANRPAKLYSLKKGAPKIVELI